MCYQLFRRFLHVCAIGVASTAAIDLTSLKSDVTILTHNDLYGSHSWRNESVLVLESWQSADAALTGCNALGERLWSPSTADFLPYLAFEGKGGLYWASEGRCANITTDGFAGDILISNDCPQSLPALCTNSAPLSNSTYADNSSSWQVLIMGDAETSFLGYRDKRAFVFQGIPYANPFARWTYSTVSNATGQIAALAYGAQCVQSGGVGSEDCLFLNVWTPYLPDSAAQTRCLKPVMLQIHGGAFTGGTGADPSLEGGNLASRGDVVVVTINYRLTTLGFLALEDGVTNGNYGFGDQVTALEWVHKYIKSFGGDPERVTIFGQSAGAGSVRAHLGSPRAIGLFSAAIMESNLAGLAYATTYSDYYTIAQEVEVAANPILNSTGCIDSSDQLDCLRAVDAHLLANLTDVARYLVIDGTYLITERLQVTGNGPTANVPVMTGFMRDDGASFIDFPTAQVINVSSELNPLGFQGHLPGDLTNLYPIPEIGTNTSLNLYNASAAVATDTEFRCLDEATAYSAVLHGVWPKAYVFTFNRTYNGYDPNPPVCEAPVELPDYPYGNPSAEYFKCHSGELNYVFGGLGYSGAPDRDGFDYPMSQLVVDVWTAFARTYDPNPELHYLAARGYTNTTAEIKQSGTRWAQLDVENVSNLTLRVFQWPTYQAPFDIFSSKARCDAFGFGIDFYERNGTIDLS